MLGIPTLYIILIVIILSIIILILLYINRPTYPIEPKREHSAEPHMNS